MSTPPKAFVKQQPVSKNKLMEMLAQAVRNTQPELNRPTVPEPEPKPKRDKARASSRTPASKRTPTSKPTKRPTKGKKDRVRRWPVRPACPAAGKPAKISAASTGNSA